MKRYILAAIISLWALSAQAQSPCTQEWRQYTIGIWNDGELEAESVRFLMVTFGYQPVGGPSISNTLLADGTLHVAIMQALAFQRCTSDPRRPGDEITAEQLNAALVARGLPAAFGKKIR